MNDQFVTLKAMEAYFHRTQIESLIGEVVSVGTNSAKVVLWGATRPTDCGLARGLNVVRGDKVVLTREANTNRWIAIASYSNPKFGAPDSVNTVSSDDRGAVRPGNVVSYTGGTGQVNSWAAVNVYNEAARIKFTNKSDTIWVGAEMNINVVGNGLVTFSFDVYIDNQVVTINNVLAQGRIGGVANTGMAIGFTRPIKGVSPGTHSISLMQQRNSVVSASVGVVDFWAADF